MTLLHRLTGEDSPVSAYSGNNEVSLGQALLVHINIAEAAALLLQAKFRVPDHQVKLKQAKIGKICLEIRENCH